MKEYLRVDRNSILFCMKTLLFIIPIWLITNNLYKLRYGDYSVLLNYELMANFFVHHVENWVFTIVFFSGLFWLSYKLETIIFPLLVIGFLGANKERHIKQFIGIGKSFVQKRFNINPSHFINPSQKMGFISHLMFIPVTVILWMVYINNLWSYISILIIVIFFVAVFKLVNSLYEHH